MTDKPAGQRGYKKLAQAERRQRDIEVKRRIDRLYSLLMRGRSFILSRDFYDMETIAHAGISRKKYAERRKP